MADKTTQQKEVESSEEAVTKAKPATEEVDGTTENDTVEKSAENGEKKEVENGEDNNEDEEKNGDGDETDKVCSIKRKSVGGGDATENLPQAEGVTPEKKAKLDETAEAESNGEAEVTA